MNKTRGGRAFIRFFRTIGGTVLGQAASAGIAAVAAYDYTTPEGILIGTALTTVLLAVDKYFRDSNKPQVQE